MNTGLLKAKFEELLVDLGVTDECRESRAHEVAMFSLAFMHGVNASDSAYNHVVTGLDFVEGGHIRVELHEVIGSVCAFELYGILVGADTKEFDVVLKWAKSLIGKTIRMKTLSVVQHISSYDVAEIIESEE